MAENGRIPERTRKDNLQNPPFNNPSQSIVWTFNSNIVLWNSMM